MESIDQYLGKIIQGDCLDVMRRLPDGCVDLILTDPPYGIGDMISGTISKHRLHKTRYNAFEDSERYVFERVIPAIQECLRISVRTIITPGWKCLKYYPQWNGFGCFYMPSACGMQLWGSGDSQPIIYYGRPFDIGKKIHKCSYVLTEPPSCKEHPCSKPLMAWKKIIETRTRKGDIVFDPFLGSGTSAVAAEQLGRRWFGCEISPEYCAIAEDRIKAAQSGLTVAEFRNGQKALFEDK